MAAPPYAARAPLIFSSAALLLLILLPYTGPGARDTRQPAASPGGYPTLRQAQAMEQQARLARGVFLIAKQSMPDPNFAGTVLLITEYKETGTVGLVLNRPLDRPAQEVLPELSELVPEPFNIFLGGPVRLNSLRLLVQTETDLGDHHFVVENLFQITDLKGVQHLLKQELGQFRLRLYAGYAGWSPGQLERELLRGDWHLSRADPDLVFTDAPASLWEELIEQMDRQWVSRDKTAPAWAELDARRIFADPLYQNEL